MKRLLKKIVIGYIFLNLVLAGLFLSAGGLQMLKQPEIPVVESPPSLQSDLKFFHDLVLANEQGITPEQAAAFTRIVERAPAPQTADALTLTVLQALAVFDNAHTTALTTRMFRLPVRFHWTADGLIIVKARPEYAHLLGQRVLSLGGYTPEDLVTRTALLTGGGTDSWRKYRSEFLLSAPSALSQLGANVEDGSVAVQLLDPQGSASTQQLTADTELMPGDPFWDFRNAFPDDESFDTSGWVSLLHRDEALPLYLQESDKLHLLRDIPGHGAIYLRMNASFADKGQSLDQFEQRILDLAAGQKPTYFIVDFRYNRGGDYTKVLSIVKSVSSAVPADGRLYLIVGPNTFSAGIIAASQFKQYLPQRLTVVGSEIGDSLRFRAEGFYPTLPASGIQLYLTKAWTDLVDGCGWLDDCWPPNKLLLKEVGALEVDIPAENTWESYRTRKDLVLEAVLADIERQQAADDIAGAQ